MNHEQVCKHVTVIHLKLTSQSIFRQANYPVEVPETPVSQNEIETGAKNANQCDINWARSKTKSHDSKLTNVTSQIGENMYNGMSPSEIIENTSKAFVLMHNHFLEARKEVLGEQNISCMKDVATISY